MRIAVVATSICLSIVGLASATDAQARVRQATNIPAQPLDSALRALAKERGFHIVYLTGTVNSLRTQGATGNFTRDEAITQLLIGTGLGFRYLDDETITLVSAQPLPEAGVPSGEPMERSSLWERFRLAQVDQGQGAAGGRATEVSGAGQDESTELQEVVVTAQKRVERLLDTPQSVTVLSSDALAKLGATQFRDFANTVPGLNFTTAGAGNTQISLRGVTTGFDVSPTTATYLDEVPYGSSTPFANSAQLGLDPALFGLERIEVLRGPQGTIYGASAMGGLIKYVSRTPDTSRFGVEAQTGISSTKDGGVGYHGNASLNAPLVTDKAALRASLFESRDGGYIDNLATGYEDANRSDVYGGRADLLLVPSSTLTVRLNAFLQNISRDGDGTADYTSTGDVPFGALGQNRPAGEPFEQRYRLFSGTVTYDIGPATLTSISSYQTVRSEFVWDLSSIYVPLLASAFGRTYSSASVPVDSQTDKFTQEVRLSSNGKQAIEWLAGLFYTNEDSSLEQFFALRDLAGQPAPNDLFTFFVPSRYEEYAGFGDLTWHLSDRFDVTGGVRYAKNRQRFSQTGSGVLGLSAPTNRASSDVFTYLANARYHFSERQTAYVRYATGYRPGGPAYVTIDTGTGLPNGPATFEADRLKSYEIGFKSETQDRRFGIEAAGYVIDWTDMQVAFNNNGFSSVHNAPGADIQGVELTFTARPVRAFSFTGALAWQDAKVSEADLQLGAHEDEKLPNVPRISGTLSADYDLPMGLPVETWAPTIGATVRYVDDRKAGFGNTAYQLPGYTTVDLRTGATVGPVNLQLYVHNLFDEYGQLSVAYPQFGGRVAVLQPRTIGLTATMSF